MNEEKKKISSAKILASTMLICMKPGTMRHYSVSAFEIEVAFEKRMCRK